MEDLMYFKIFLGVLGCVVERFSPESLKTGILASAPTFTGASQVAQMVKNLPAMPETSVQSLGHEDPLEKGVATLCRILAWRIPWTEKPGGLQSMGLQRVSHDWATNTHTTIYSLRDVEQALQASVAL